MPDPAPPFPFTIVPYRPGDPAHRAAIRDLNLAWIERHFVVEARDRHELDDPERHVLAPGGEIFMAEDAHGEVLGTCAIVPEDDGTLSLVKMAVRDSARGLGIGRALGEAAVAAARARGAPRLELLSNTALAPALSLYRALGFVEAPMPATEYARANVRMVRELGEGGSGMGGGE